MNVTYTVLLESFYFQGGGIAFRILWYPFIFMQIVYHVIKFMWSITAIVHVFCQPTV